MKVKVICLPWSAERSVFLTGELELFCAENEVLSMHEHFFVHEGRPQWVLMLGYRPIDGSGNLEPPSAPRRRRKSAADWRDGLDPEECARFEKLRSWRAERSRAFGRPPFAIFTNAQLAKIASVNPQNLAGLGAIHGVGEAKLRDLGASLLAVLAASTSEPSLEEEST